MGLVLAIGAHTDDVELGCGATLMKHKILGDEVHVWIASDCTYALPEDYEGPSLTDEFEASMAMLDIHNIEVLDFKKNNGHEHARLRDTIWNTMEELQPDYIYTPHSACLNQEHRHVSLATLQAGYKRMAQIRGYVLPNEWLGFSPRYFEPLKWDWHIVPVLDAITIAYRSQLELRPIMFRREALASKYYVYSSYAGEPFVEPFEVLKSVGRRLS